MKKILILSYHALPMDVVSSYRVKGFCDHLATFGILPTLVTHRWDLDESGHWSFHSDDDIVTEKNTTFTVIRLPRKKSLSSSSKMKTVLGYMKGDLEYELIGSYKVFRNFLLEHLKSEQYNAVLVIYSPHFQMKLAYELKKEFGTPYITDFRDLWDNQIMTKSYHPNLKMKIINQLVRHWWSLWIKHSEFFTTTGESWKRYLEDLTGKRGYVVRNGFESNIVVNRKENVRPSEFIITHFGKLYPYQDLDTFLEGYRLFIKRSSGKRIMLEFIGIKTDHGVDILPKLSGLLPGESWRILPYKNKAELFDYCANQSSVFWMPSFNEDNGSFAVKVYDYLMLKKNILCASVDETDMQRVILNTHAGVICSSPEDVCAQLTVWHSSFEQTGSVQYNGDEEAIQSYARFNQVKILADKIHEHIS